MQARLLQFLLAILLVGLAAASGATSLTRADVEQQAGGEFIVGEMPASLPAWPLYRRNAGDPNQKPQHIGWAFESVDIAPVRGYSGKPIHLFIVVDREGRFVDAKLLDHREPLFRSETGQAKLRGFVAQYPGLSTSHQIEIRGPDAATSRNQREAVLHGIQAGTVTARAIDRTVLQSVTEVLAQGDGALAASAGGTAPSARRAREVEVRTLDREQLLRRGMIELTRLTRADIERRFTCTRAAGADPLAKTYPDELAIGFETAVVSLPQIGRNLLDEHGWRLLQANLRGGEAVLVIEHGPLAAALRRQGGSSLPFVLKQEGRTLQLRQLALDEGVKLPAPAGEHKARLLLVDAATPLDPDQPFELAFRLQRRYGPFPTMVEEADFALGNGYSGWRATLWSWFDASWLENWRQRAGEVTLLCAALVLLSGALVKQRALSATALRLRRFRVPFLLFTLVGIGWWFQGQLSIVNITASMEALAAGDGLDFLLTDPMTVLLWLFALGTLFVWGRGTFCGWLCPFGALQELLSKAMRLFGLRHRRLRPSWDRQLKRLKYLVLAVLLVLVWVSPPAAELALEIEPFKTAISLYFQRDWPYVAWALGCLGLSVLVYRGYCRYLCPLGAALAVLDPLRRIGWLPRRDACGQPCQTCRHRCDYQSIRPDGAVDYAECFQCLDCVAIMQDHQQCLPLIREHRRVVPITPVKVHA